MSDGTTYKGSDPMPYPGTAADHAENLASHDWPKTSPDARCRRCDCKPWYVAARWPCGADVPRVSVTA